jgi:hypothetical protein
MKLQQSPIQSFRLFGQACIGAYVGAVLALVLAQYCFAVGSKGVIPDEVLPWIADNVLFKPREKAFYLFTLVLGFLGASFATKRVWSIHPLNIFVALVLGLPIFNLLAKLSLQTNQINSFLIPFLTLAILVLSVFHFGASKWTLKSNSPLSFRFPWKLYLAGLLGILLVLLPSSFSQVAAQVGMEMHVASFMIAPALYFLGDHLVPGLDYFSQYSIGMGWLFSYLLGNSASTAILNYTYFVIAVMSCFYFQLLYMLIWLYRSWLTAAIVTFLSLILLFHTTRHFFDPSSSVLRYPLLGVCAWLLARWLRPNRINTDYVWLALALALSLFLNTETGVIMIVATVAAILLVAQEPFKMILPIGILGLLTLTIFIGILMCVFGKTSLNPAFYISLIKPFFIYGKVGFGGRFIAWRMNELNWFYNLVAPGVAIATLALVRYENANQSVGKPRLGVLAFFTVAGLLMMAKFINMSLIAVWQMNALGLLIPLGWWALQLVNDTCYRPKQIRFLVCAVMLIFTCWLAIFSSDEQNPARYGLRSWLKYPALVTKPFNHHRVDCANLKCMPNKPDKKDVVLITQRTKAHEQVAIIDLYDWTYLVNAKRPPLMFFLPAIDIFTREQLIQSMQRLEKAPYLFLPARSDHQPQIDGPLNILIPNFHQHYVLDGKGEKLVAWKRIK